MPLVNNKLILCISSAINSVGLSLQQFNSGPKIDHLESLLGEVGKKQDRQMIYKLKHKILSLTIYLTCSRHILKTQDSSQKQFYRPSATVSFNKLP